MRDQRIGLESRWPTDWPILVEPKAALGRLTHEIPITLKATVLTTALAARVRDDPDVRPVELEAFRAHVADLLDVSSPTANAHV